MALRGEPYFHQTPHGQRNRHEVCLDRKRLRQRGKKGYLRLSVAAEGRFLLSLPQGKA